MGGGGGVYGSCSSVLFSEGWRFDIFSSVHMVQLHMNFP